MLDLLIVVHSLAHQDRTVGFLLKIAIDESTKHFIIETLLMRFKQLWAHLTVADHPQSIFCHIVANLIF